jgi:hypothetical protein
VPPRRHVTGPVAIAARRCMSLQAHVGACTIYTITCCSTAASDCCGVGGCLGGVLSAGDGVRHHSMVHGLKCMLAQRPCIVHSCTLSSTWGCIWCRRTWWDHLAVCHTTVWCVALFVCHGVWLVVSLVRWLFTFVYVYQQGCRQSQGPRLMGSK